MPPSRAIDSSPVYVAERSVSHNFASIASDFTFVMPFSTFHESAIPPKFIPTIECVVPQGYFGGAGGKHKLTAAGPRKVLHCKQPIVCRGHDVGLLIVHVAVSLNAMQAAVVSVLSTLFSSRKCVAGSSRVQLESVGALGTCLPFPMLCCANPVSVPLGWSVSLTSYNLRFSMTWADVLRGLMTMVAEALINKLCDKILKSQRLAKTVDKLKGGVASLGRGISAKVHPKVAGFAAKVGDKVYDEMIGVPLKGSAQSVWTAISERQVRELTIIDAHVWSFSVKDVIGPSPGPPDHDHPHHAVSRGDEVL